MLLRFGVANHRSIREYQELLLTASRTKGEGLTMPVPVADESVVPVTALYGANGSGKSNLLDAMEDLQLLVTDSHKGRDSTDRIRRSPFRLNSNSAQQPTRFECGFTIEPPCNDDASTDQAVYDLEIEFTELEIRHERLRRSTRHARRSTHTLYSRDTTDDQVNVQFGVHLQGENQVIANLTRPNSLFLSAAAQNNHPQLTQVHKWFSDWNCLFSSDPMPEQAAAATVADHRQRKWLESLLKQSETGVGGIEVDEIETDPRLTEFARELAELLASHAEDDHPDPRAFATDLADAAAKRIRLLHESDGGFLPLAYDSESRGTRMFLTLVLPALEALSAGRVLIIDELDSSLHPRLADAFVSLFLAPESNPHGAQIIFSTHDVALLGTGRLRQDEIWLVNQDPQGRVIPHALDGLPHTRRRRTSLPKRPSWRDTGPPRFLPEYRGPPMKRYRRRQPSKQPKPRVVVVTEGTVTEPGYLSLFHRIHGSASVVVEPVPLGKDPRSVVERAISERDNARADIDGERDTFWAMFDRDEFDNFKEALDLARRKQHPCRRIQPVLRTVGDPLLRASGSTTRSASVPTQTRRVVHRVQRVQQAIRRTGGDPSASRQRRAPRTHPDDSEI